MLQPWEGLQIQRRQRRLTKRPKNEPKRGNKPVKNEQEKSQRLTDNLRADIITASLAFCFKPLSEIFEELYVVLAWDLYHTQTPSNLLTLYYENKEIMGHLVEETNGFSIQDMGYLPAFKQSGYSMYNNTIPDFPYKLPLLSREGRRHGSHELKAPPEGTNKKERALRTRYEQLRKDIKIFSTKVKVFHKELSLALNSCSSTKQFNEQNPEFEGYMKQSLKKFYDDKHPNVINSLSSAMDVRTYASLTSAHRLQAYQASMLAQLQQLESRHTQPPVAQ